jgi:N-acetylglucosamine kinase-like BadF-type ATPase
MLVFLGIDGGGSKTHFLLADGEGHVLSSHKLGGIDFTRIGIDGVRKMLEEGTSSVLRKASITVSDLSAVCIGIPYFDEDPKWNLESTRICGSLFPDIYLRCVNDSIVALYGALGFQPGIHLIAGTGSMACGRNSKNEFARSGGWHELFSDEGSCYWLGQRTCSLFTRQSDGRLARGPLYHLIRQEFAIEHDFDFVTFYRDQLLGAREKIAALQIILAKAAEAGDPSALQAYVDASFELTALVQAVHGQLFSNDQAAVPVTCSGGLMKAGKLIMDPLQERLEILNFRWTQPLLPPTAGAILAACEDIGYSPGDLSTILESLKWEVHVNDIH